MNRPSKRSVGLAIAAAIAGVAVTRANAQDGSDPVVEQARSQGLVGEPVDGYLGFAKSPAADLKARVDAINIKRRARSGEQTSDLQPLMRTSYTVLCLKK